MQQAVPKAKRAAGALSTPLLPAPNARPPGDGRAKEGQADWQRRLLCVGVCFGIFAAYVLVRTVVMFLFGSYDSAPAPAPAPEEHERPVWPHEMCKIPVEDYSTDQKIINQCKTKSSWESVAGISGLDDGGCFLNKTTSEIDCSRKESCHGGQQQVHKWSSLHNNLTYNCAGKCEGTLRVNCCKTCQSIRHTDADYRFIHCEGCEANALRNIVNKNTLECSLDANGFFSCVATDDCKVVPSVTHAKLIHRLSCSITPCGVCATRQLRAKCCSICLASLCNKPKDRVVCSGCSPSELSQAQQPLFLADI